MFNPIKNSLFGGNLSGNVPVTSGSGGTVQNITGIPVQLQAGSLSHTQGGNLSWYIANGNVFGKYVPPPSWKDIYLMLKEIDNSHVSNAFKTRIINEFSETFGLNRKEGIDLLKMILTEGDSS